MLDDMVGSETESAKNMRKSRAKKKKENSQCDNNVKQCDIEIEIEKEKDKNIEIELDGEGESTHPPISEPKKPYGVFENVYLTDNELYELYDIMKKEMTVNDSIDYLSAYMRSHGKEDEYKDHFAILVQWYTEDQKKATQEGRDRYGYTERDTGGIYDMKKFV